MKVKSPVFKNRLNERPGEPGVKVFLAQLTNSPLIAEVPCLRKPEEMFLDSLPVLYLNLKDLCIKIAYLKCWQANKFRGLF